MTKPATASYAPTPTSFGQATARLQTELFGQFHPHGSFRARKGPEEDYDAARLAAEVKVQLLMANAVGACIAPRGFGVTNPASRHATIMKEAYDQAVANVVGYMGENFTVKPTVEQVDAACKKACGMSAEVSLPR